MGYDGQKTAFRPFSPPLAGAESLLIKGLLLQTDSKHEFRAGLPGNLRRAVDQVARIGELASLVR